MGSCWRVVFLLQVKKNANFTVALLSACPRGFATAAFTKRVPATNSPRWAGRLLCVCLAPRRFEPPNHAHMCPKNASPLRCAQLCTYRKESRVTFYVISVRWLRWNLTTQQFSVFVFFVDFVFVDLLKSRPPSIVTNQSFDLAEPTVHGRCIFHVVGVFYTLGRNYPGCCRKQSLWREVSSVTQHHDYDIFKNLLSSHVT